MSGYSTHQWIGAALVEAGRSRFVAGAAGRYDPPVPQIPNRSAVSEATPKPVVLVVDDEPELRTLLGEYFERHGYAVTTAADAAAARMQLAELRPALAILDVNMPGENGLSLARWLREAHPRVGIVMLTTAGESVDRIVGLELGADDYIPKPFEMR